MKNKNKFLYNILFLSFVALLFVGSQMVIAAPESVCGDGHCASGETVVTCPADCSLCGNGTCDTEAGETPVTCGADCAGSFCGDDTCDDDESIETCPSDCSLPDPQPDPGTSTPSCEDVKIDVGEETVCSIKVENTETFPLTEVTAEIVIPNNIEKISNTDLWTCTSTAEGTQCQKTYNPYLIMGEIDYLELTLATDVEGDYGLSVTINGQGESFQAVSYTSSEQITTTESATAIAFDDYAHDFGGGGCWETITMDIASNDVLCSSGVTSFNHYNFHPGVVVDSLNSVTGEITLDLSMGQLFEYDILCDGVVIDSATAQCLAG